MKKLVIALTALAAFTGSASAADLGARPYTKAPAPVVMAPSWTGFYIFGGGGGGLWSANGGVDATATGICIICTNTRTGGDGWFGTVGAGYDWQTGPSWVFGIFGDGTFGSLKGNIGDAGLGAVGIVGTAKMETAWAAGARVGYLVAPNVLSYVNGGYTGTYWKGSTLLTSDLGIASGLHTDSFNTQGWFVGGGVENNLNIFGITAPGWFMKTEYRAAYLDSKRLNERIDGTNVLNGRDITFKPFVQTISTSLVYRFNWGGAPISAKY
jgi:outer membrane immunogenic protein